MRMLWLIALSIVISGTVIANPCVTTNGYDTNNSSTRIKKVGAMPNYVSQGIESARVAWNAPSCNKTGYDFPKFVNDFAEAELSVRYETADLSVQQTVDGSSVCAEIIGSGNTAEITLYKSFKTSQGEVFECPKTSPEVADSVAHELGHYLGLGHPPPNSPTCLSYIMAPRHWTSIGGEAITLTDRSIKAAECATADNINLTKRELCDQYMICSGSGGGIGPLDDDPDGGLESADDGASGNNCFWHCYPTTWTGMYCDLLC